MRLIVLSQRTQTINHATAHKKSAVLLMRIARGESVGYFFGTPVNHKTHHTLKSACITIGLNSENHIAYSSPVTYYFRACYTNLSFLRFSWLCTK